MDNIYLFEAGATKTQLWFNREGAKNEMSLPGFNPNRDNGAFEIAIQEGIDIPADASVFFYGSGLGSDANKELVKRLFSDHNLKKLKVHDDILGGARAAFNSSAGIICIMGTGGLAAYYNGREIEKRRGGYGYLIDDLGGGFELGKVVIAAWLNGDLIPEDEELLANELGLTKETIVEEVYSEKNLKLIASVSTVVPKMTGEVIRGKVTSYFEQFLKENVLPLAEEFGSNQFSIVGSLGTGFYQDIRNLAGKLNLQLDQCIQNPIQRLFEFHNKQL